MKRAITMIAAAVSVMVSAWSLRAEDGASSMSFNVHTRVGDGWHMTTTAVLTNQGEIKGTTILENYNNVFGFTGGVFVVALDENNEAVYSTGIHNFGINSAGFKKMTSRMVSWSDSIPPEYLSRIDKITIVQAHNATNRVWTWIYDHREVIIKNAIAIAELFIDYKSGGAIDPEDIFGLVESNL
jgi:hypothetical protein